MTAAPLPVSAPGESEPRRPQDAPGTLREAAPIFLSHASPRFLVVAVALAATIRAVLGEWSWRDPLTVLLVVAYWPIQEWLIHVFILHWRPRPVLGRTLDFRVPRKHREHHRDPWNYEILFIPFHSFVYSAPILVALWCALAPSLPVAMTGVTAHLLGALHYEAVHFLTHTRVRPRGRHYQRIWHHHRLHHFKSEKHWFGVTTSSADRLLGTAPDAESIETSPTARNLFGPLDA